MIAYQCNSDMHRQLVGSGLGSLWYNSYHSSHEPLVDG